MSNHLPLAFIPNTKGFKFFGITKDDKKIKCQVAINDAYKFHYIIDENGNEVFNLLKAWERV